MLLDDSDSGCLKTVCDYVHLNTARAKRLSPGQKLSAFRWSSYGEYLKRPASEGEPLGAEGIEEAALERGGTESATERG